MDKPSDSYGAFWQYISQPQKDLILQGDYLMNQVIRQQSYQFKDYSFLVFPYAKAYEGFLKKLFLDLGLISHLDYISDHFRLGKLLSANLVQKLGERSLYFKIKQYTDSEIADKIWKTWKSGRNEIFHYFPHNLRSVSFEEAEKIISEIIDTMEAAYQELKVKQGVLSQVAAAKE